MVKYLDNNNNSGFMAWNANRNANAKKQGGGFFRWFLIFVALWWVIGIMFGKNTNVTNVLDTPAIEEDISNVPTYEIKADKISANVQGLRISNVDLLDFPVSADSSDTVKLLSGENAFA